MKNEFYYTTSLRPIYDPDLDLELTPDLNPDLSN